MATDANDANPDAATELPAAPPPRRVPVIGSVVVLGMHHPDPSESLAIVPALITTVEEPGEPDSTVSLVAFSHPMRQVVFLHGAPYSAVPALGSWCWPEAEMEG